MPAKRRWGKSRPERGSSDQKTNSGCANATSPTTTICVCTQHAVFTSTAAEQRKWRRAGASPLNGSAGRYYRSQRRMPRRGRLQEKLGEVTGMPGAAAGMGIQGVRLVGLRRRTQHERGRFARQHARARRAASVFAPAASPCTARHNDPYVLLSKRWDWSSREFFQPRRTAPDQNKPSGEAVSETSPCTHTHLDLDLDHAASRFTPNACVCSVTSHAPRYRHSSAGGRMKGTRRARARTRPPAASTRLVAVRDQPWLELPVTSKSTCAERHTLPGCHAQRLQSRPVSPPVFHPLHPIGCCHQNAKFAAAALQAFNIPRIAHQHALQESRTPSLRPCISPSCHHSLCKAVPIFLASPTS